VSSKEMSSSLSSPSSPALPSLSTHNQSPTKRQQKKKITPSQLPFTKPSAKKTDPQSVREREVIQQMENRELAKAQQANSQHNVDGDMDGNPNDVDSLIFSDDDSSLQTVQSSLTGGSSHDSPPQKKRHRPTKSQKGRKKMYDEIGIDDDDISLASLISEMSLDDLISFDNYDDKDRISKSRAKHPNRKRNLDVETDWQNLYPYNPNAEQATANMKLVADNIAFNDPIARPGANTAYQGLRSRGGMGMEATLQLSQNQKVVGAPPLMMKPPALPSIDSHVNDSSLHLENITNNLRASKGLWNRNATIAHGSSDNSTTATVETQAEKKKDDHGGFKRSEIRLVIKFIDNLGSGEGAGDGLIDVMELEHAFRMGRRVRANAASDKEGMLLAIKFEKMLNDNLTSLSTWFSQNDTSGAGKGDGRLGVLEIRAGVRKLGDKSLPKVGWSEAQLLALTRYLDPNGDGDLDIGEFRSGIKRAKEPPAARNFQRKAGRILARLESFMNENNMRIKDLFAYVDKDRSGHIDMDELKGGLVEMATNGAEKFAKKREGLVAKRKKKKEEEARMLDDQVSSRLTTLKKTGALNVLSELDVFMHKTGSRIVDLFGKGGFDKSGDGSLNTAEFYKAMKHIGLDVSKKGCKALVAFIDSSGDGEIEAYELEKVLRRYRIDMIYIRDKNEKSKPKYNNEGTRPESDDTSDNDFVLMMKAQASKRGGLLQTLKKEATASKLKLEESEKKQAKKKDKKMGYWKQMELRNMQQSLPKIPKKTLKVTSGSMLDGTWLHSFDKSMKTHFRALAK